MSVEEWERRVTAFSAWVPRLELGQIVQELRDLEQGWPQMTAGEGERAIEAVRRALETHPELGRRLRERLVRAPISGRLLEWCRDLQGAFWSEADQVAITSILYWQQCEERGGEEWDAIASLDQRPASLRAEALDAFFRIEPPKRLVALFAEDATWDAARISLIIRGGWVFGRWASQWPGTWATVERGLIRALQKMHDNSHVLPPTERTWQVAGLLSASPLRLKAEVQRCFPSGGDVLAGHAIGASRCLYLAGVVLGQWPGRLRAALGGEVASAEGSLWGPETMAQFWSTLSDLLPFLPEEVVSAGDAQWLYGEFLDQVPEELRLRVVETLLRHTSFAELPVATRAHVLARSNAALARVLVGSGIGRGQR